MLVSGRNLSLIGRAAISNAGGARASQRPAPDPIEPTDRLRDPTSSEYRELQLLQKRDRDVRQHERAHVAAGGQHVRGGADYTYETGPDGRRYAIGGEVQIDTAPVPDNPEATIRKMQVVRRAALAPAAPSAQDRAVAAEASRAEAEARVELQEQRRQERAGATGDDAATENRSSDHTPAIAAYQDAAMAGIDNGVVQGRLDVVA